MKLILPLLIFFQFFNCKQTNVSKDKSDLQNKLVISDSLHKREFDFLDNKYQINGYHLIIDESNTSDHPFYSYLECNNEGYFAVHFVPKDISLQKFWAKEYYEKINVETYDIEKDNTRIKNLLEKHFEKYNIFSYHIKKEYLNQTNGCTIESIFANKNAVAEIYLFNQKSNKWELLKTNKSEVLPPYIDTQFFVSKFPNFFENQNKTANKTQEQIYSFSYDLNSDGTNDKIVLYKNNKESDEFAKEHFGLQIKVFKGTSNGGLNLWHQNENVITENENTCVSEGFDTVIVKDNYFTIQQQTCYDYNIIVNAYITFVIKNDEIYLHKYGETYFDKANHERKMPERIWTTKDFGLLKFENTTVEFLAKLRQNLPKN